LGLDWSGRRIERGEKEKQKNEENKRKEKEETNKLKTNHRD
jgi:hypothetical protein